MRPFKKMLLISVSVFSTLMLSPLIALTAQRVSVEIRHQGTDNVGSRLIYQIKEGIRRSSGLRLTTSNEPRLILRIMTDKIPGDILNIPSSEISVIGTVTTFSILGGDIYLSSQLGFVGAGKINEFAESIIAHIDKQADPYRK